MRARVWNNAKNLGSERGTDRCDTVDVIRSERGVHYGTCEDEKIGGDAEVVACEGDDETAVAQTGAEVCAACSTVWNFRINGRAVESV